MPDVPAVDPALSGDGADDGTGLDAVLPADLDPVARARARHGAPAPAAAGSVTAALEGPVLVAPRLEAGAHELPGFVEPLLAAGPAPPPAVGLRSRRGALVANGLGDQRRRDVLDVEGGGHLLQELPVHSQAAPFDPCAHALEQPAGPELGHGGGRGDRHFLHRRPREFLDAAQARVLAGGEERQ